MSWSVNAIGKSSAVKTKVLADIERISCAEPEQSIKGQVAAIIDASLSAYPEDAVVKVEGFGSQSTPGNGKAINIVSLKIEPVHGFLG